MVERNIREVSKILEAYIRVLGSIGGAVTYLYFITAAILGAELTTLAYYLLKGYMIVALSAVSFIAAFFLAGYGSSAIWRIHHMYFRLVTSREMEKKYKRVEAIAWLGWLISILAAFIIAHLTTPFPMLIPVAVSLGVGLGNISMSLIYWLMVGERDLRPLIVGLYLLLTIPLYYYVELAMLYALLLTSLSASYLGVALSYTVEAMKRAKEVLHAARE